ncbi:MAG: type II secretion system protein [Candidatus Paceibacterota bacterium]
MKLVGKRGFTLIELLVVISIIGLLGSIVLASLSDAKGKGNTAAIKSTLVNVRTQAELVFASGYSFEGVCSDSIIVRAMSEAQRLNGGTAPLCYDGRSSWAISSVIPDGAFCVDADGVAKEYDSIGDTLGEDDTSCN